MEAENTKICQSCSSAFSCGVCSTGKCWCGDYPMILSCAGEHVDCLCPECLKQNISQEIDKYVAEIKSGVRENDTNQYATKSPKEGIDYYIENGLYVFTAWYHLKRGECCGNGCRHCPY